MKPTLIITSIILLLSALLGTWAWQSRTIIASDLLSERLGAAITIDELDIKSLASTIEIVLKGLKLNHATLVGETSIESVQTAIDLAQLIETGTLHFSKLEVSGANLRLSGKPLTQTKDDLNAPVIHNWRLDAVTVTYADDGRVLDGPDALSEAFQHAIATEIALKGHEMEVNILLRRSKDGAVDVVSGAQEEMFACEVCDGLVSENDSTCPHCGAVFEEEDDVAEDVSEPAPSRSGPPGPSRSGPPGPSKGGPPGPSKGGPPGPKKGGGPPGPSKGGPPGPKKGGGPPGPSKGGPPGPKKAGGPPKGGPSGGPPKGGPSGGPKGPRRGPPGR